MDKLYQKKWQKNNPEKLKRYQKKYYDKNKKKQVAKAKRWNQAHPELHRKRVLKWNKENPEKYRANKKSYKLRNPEKHKEWGKKWREKNKEKLKEYQKKYKSQPEVRKRYKKYMEKWNLNRREKIVGSPKPDICPVCMRKPAGGGRAKGRICIDHCHKTNKIRGWLCDDCNVALGRVDDRVDILKNLIKYLNKNL